MPFYQHSPVVHRKAITSALVCAIAVCFSLLYTGLTPPRLFTCARFPDNCVRHPRGRTLVMVPARTVCMAVFDFLRRRVADTLDTYGKMEPDAGQFVIAVDGYGVSFDGRDADG